MVKRKLLSTFFLWTRRCSTVKPLELKLLLHHTAQISIFFFQKAAQRSERGNELVSVFCMYTNNFVILNLQIQNMLLAGGVKLDFPHYLKRYKGKNGSFQQHSRRLILLTAFIKQSQIQMLLLRETISEESSINFHPALVSPFTQGFKLFCEVCVAPLVIRVIIVSVVGAQHLTRLCSSIVCRINIQPQACVCAMDHEVFSVTSYFAFYSFKIW